VARLPKRLSWNFAGRKKGSVALPFCPYRVAVAVSTPATRNRRRTRQSRQWRVASAVQYFSSDVLPDFDPLPETDTLKWHCGPPLPK